MVNSFCRTNGHEVSIGPSMSTGVQDLARKVAAGALWMVALRLTTRLLGVASMLVLARLLTPEDFGLVALATTIAALLDIASDFNFDLAIIRDRGAGRLEYDTAWTLQVLKGLLLALLLLVMAAPTAGFFADPRLEPILGWLALAAFIQGIGNIGTVDFRRELDIAREFRFHLYGRLAQFATGIALAVMWRDWRALVAAIMARRVVLLVASYTMAPYRPRLSLARTRALVDFSKWVLANNALSFVRERIDALIVGKLAGPAPLGLYTIAQEIADLPTR
jgi:PST family polysaccharide transporter